MYSRIFRFVIFLIPVVSCLFLAYFAKIPDVVTAQLGEGWLEDTEILASSGFVRRESTFALMLQLKDNRWRRKAERFRFKRADRYDLEFAESMLADHFPGHRPGSLILHRRDTDSISFYWLVPNSSGQNSYLIGLVP